MKETRRGNEITLSASLRDDNDMKKLMNRARQILLPEGRECCAVVTPEMIQAGMIAARRGGLGPVATYAQFQRFKSGLIAAYRAMRAFEQDDLRGDECVREIENG